MSDNAFASHGARETVIGRIELAHSVAIFPTTDEKPAVMMEQRLPVPETRIEHQPNSLTNEFRLLKVLTALWKKRGKLCLAHILPIP